MHENYLSFSIYNHDICLKWTEENILDGPLDTVLDGVLENVIYFLKLFSTHFVFCNFPFFNFLEFKTAKCDQIIGSITTTLRHTITSEGLWSWISCANYIQGRCSELGVEEKWERWWCILTSSSSSISVSSSTVQPKLDSTNFLNLFVCMTSKTREKSVDISWAPK